MKIPLAITLAASVMLSGCSIFHRSPTWESVVASRSEYSSSGGGKDTYLNHLHQVLQGAGVEHKIVTYQFQYHNAYREEGVQSASAILYRDESTPSSPWWVMDEYHHVPVWLVNGDVDTQLEFFLQRRVEIVSTKNFAGNARAPLTRAATEGWKPHSTLAHSAREKKFRALFTASHTRSKAEKPVRTPVAPADSDPLTATVLSGHAPAAADIADSRAAALFRSSHGTQFDPGSSTDRSKMNELRRQLLNRSQRVSLRTQ